MRKTSFLLILCTMFYACDQRNEPVEEAKKNVMKYSEVDSYMALTNHFDQEDNYYEILPYALKMQEQGLGHYEFYHSYLKIAFENKFDSKNILKLKKPEIEFLIYMLEKGLKAEESGCGDVLIQYYRNGWGVPKDIKKADSIYKSFGNSDKYIPNDK